MDKKIFVVEGFIPVSFSFDDIEAETLEEAKKVAFKRAEDNITTFGELTVHEDEGEITWFDEKENN